jgi:hypothetical protein
MANKKEELDEYMPLADALRWIADHPKYSWMPPQRLRTAVRDGEVHSRRSSPAQKARYYVRLRDLFKAVK